MSITSAISKVYDPVWGGEWGGGVTSLREESVSVWREPPTVSNAAEGAGGMRTESYPLHMARTPSVTWARAAPGE